MIWTSFVLFPGSFSSSLNMTTIYFPSVSSSYIFLDISLEPRGTIYFVMSHEHTTNTLQSLLRLACSLDSGQLLKGYLNIRLEWIATWIRLEYFLCSLTSIWDFYSVQLDSVHQPQVPALAGVSSPAIPPAPTFPTLLLTHFHRGSCRTSQCTLG